VVRGQSAPARREKANLATDETRIERRFFNVKAQSRQVAKRRRKLASYEVAGDASAMFVRPERTMDSAVLSGRISFWAVILISSVPLGRGAAKLDEGGEYAKSFLEIRSCISRGSRSICLGAHGKSAEIRK